MKFNGMITTLLLIGLVSLLSASHINAQEDSLQESTSIILTDQVNEQSFSQDSVRHPLKPPDRSSPRATLKSFLQNFNRAYRMLMEAHQENLASSGLFTPDSVSIKSEEAEILFMRAVRCLDLSQIPEKLEQDYGYEKTILLKEILDRIELPPFEAIPDLAMVEQEMEVKKYPKLDLWKIPNTSIALVRMREGPRKGEFLFTSSTVERLESFYKQVIDLPYRTDREASIGFYDFYIRTPGRLLPPKFNELLPEWSKRLIFSQTVWQWFSSLVLLILTGLLMRLLYRLLWQKKVTLFFLLTSILVLLLNEVLDEYVNLTGNVLIVTNYLLSATFWILMSIAIFFLSRAFAESIILKTNVDEQGINASYVRAIFGVFGIIAFVVILVYGLAKVGVALTPLLAGVGIGGLAIALAVRPALESIIASFAIFLERPYVLGDKIKVLGEEGKVVSIGLRTTKIRLSQGSISSLPNEKIIKAELINNSRSKFIRRKFEITVPQDMPMEMVSKAMEIIREILSVPSAPSQVVSGVPLEQSDKDSALTVEAKKPHPNMSINHPDYPPRVFFDNINSSSLNIVAFYWYHPYKRWDYLQHANDINSQIIQRFQQEGIEFAMPTQKLYLAGDERQANTNEEV